MNFFQSIFLYARSYVSWESTYFNFYRTNETFHEHNSFLTINSSSWGWGFQVDPEEEKRILSREKKASAEYFHSTLKRHTLVLKKRDLMRRKAEEEKRKVISQLLAAEGLELDTDDE